MKFVPKAGDTVSFNGDPVKVNYVGAHVVHATTPRGNELGIALQYLEEYKSDAEIEREDTVNTMLEINGYPSGYEGDMSKYMNRLYDAGYRKQQVKPLSCDEFEEMYFTTSYPKKLYELLAPHIQGGDK